MIDSLSMAYARWEYKNVSNKLGRVSIFSIDHVALMVSAVRQFYPEAVIGLTSGGFDPIHPGHISCILDARARCDKLIVVVNGSEFLRKKKGHGFQPLKVRAQIVSAIKGVDITVPFEPTNPNDLTVCEALEIIRPHKFFKGGDRNNIKELPETATCDKFGIQIVTGMGDEKQWSSSDFLRQWDERNK